MVRLARKRRRRSRAADRELTVTHLPTRYHGPISRDDVTERLKADRGGWEGWYLVRKSTKVENGFVVSFVASKKLFHNLISKDADGYVLMRAVAAAARTPIAT